MLRLQFIKFSAVAMRDAIEEARMRGEIVNTKYREVNGELYFKIPDEEVQLWLDLLEDMAKDVSGYKKIISEIIAVIDESKFKSVGEGEADGNGAAGGAAGLAAGESSGGLD